MAKLCWVYITTPNVRTAHKISDELLNQNLIACANIFPPIESRYRWKNKTTKSQEIAVIFKTRAQLFKKVKQVILKMHPYQIPCVLQINLVDVEDTFADWIIGATKAKVSR